MRMALSMLSLIHCVPWEGERGGEMDTCRRSHCQRKMKMRKMLADAFAQNQAAIVRIRSWEVTNRRAGWQLGGAERGLVGRN